MSPHMYSHSLDDWLYPTDSWNPENGDLYQKMCIRDRVPAFSGLGAPYWDSEARASVVGMSRTTRKAEFVRAALECIAYQITDVVQAMSEDAGVPVKELRVDGDVYKRQL